MKTITSAYITNLEGSLTCSRASKIRIEVDIFKDNLKQKQE